MPELVPDARAAGAGPERGRIDARRELHHPAGGLGRQRPGEPDPEVLGQVGEHVDLVADPAQQRPGAGQRRPASLVPVGEPDDAAWRPPGAAAARAARAARRRRTARVSQPCSASSAQARAPTDGTGSISEPGCRTTGNGCLASNSAAPVPGRRVDDDAVRGQPGRQRVHERLDPAAARREVVGDDQDLGHRLPRASGAAGQGTSGRSRKIRSYPGRPRRPPARYGRTIA